MNVKNLIGGLLAGAAIGVAIGILLAPASGSETRGNLAKGSRKLTDDLKKSFNDTVDQAKNKLGLGTDDLQKKGREFMNKGNDVVKA
jgi:gas vesicle protein